MDCYSVHDGDAKRIVDGGDTWLWSGAGLVGQVEVSSFSVTQPRPAACTTTSTCCAVATRCTPAPPTSLEYRLINTV